MKPLIKSVLSGVSNTEEKMEARGRSRMYECLIWDQSHVWSQIKTPMIFIGMLIGYQGSSMWLKFASLIGCCYHELFMNLSSTESKLTNFDSTSISVTREFVLSLPKRTWKWYVNATNAPMNRKLQMVVLILFFTGKTRPSPCAVVSWQNSSRMELVGLLTLLNSPAVVSPVAIALVNEGCIYWK